MLETLSKTGRLTRPLALLVCLASLHTGLLVTSMVAGAKLVALPFHLSASATVLTSEERIWVSWPSS